MDNSNEQAKQQWHFDDVVKIEKFPFVGQVYFIEQLLSDNWISWQAEASQPVDVHSCIVDGHAGAHSTSNIFGWRAQQIGIGGLWTAGDTYSIIECLDYR
jgi:hypothetical protein